MQTARSDDDDDDDDVTTRSCQLSVRVYCVLYTVAAINTVCQRVA